MSFQSVPNPLSVKHLSTDELLTRILAATLANLYVQTQILALTQGRSAPLQGDEWGQLMSSFISKIEGGR